MNQQRALPKLWRDPPESSLIASTFSNGPPWPCYFRGPSPIATVHETISLFQKRRRFN